MSLPDKFRIVIPPESIEVGKEKLALLAKGDPNTFQWIYAKFSGRVYEYALLLTGDESLSEDITQDIFIRLWNAREKLPVIKHFHAYLQRMTRNHIYNLHTRKSLEQSYKDFCAYTTPLDHGPDDSAELSRTIATAIHHLHTQQKKVYLLSRDLGWPRQQIADALQISPFTVKAHLQSAVNKIREKIADYENS